MKKHLVLGSVLFAAISAFPQSSGSKVKSYGVVNTAEKIAQRFAKINNSHETESTGSSANQPSAPIQEATENLNGRTGSITTFTTGWRPFTGSMNVFGVLVSSSKPLQYNDELNTITFIHRKSATYSMSPQPAVTGAQTGGIVAMISTNCASTWDSTLVWNNSTQWARYPQGAIFNPAGNTNINNAYITAMGPLTQPPPTAGWIGNFFTSKQLGTANYNNVASSTFQQFQPSTPPYGTMDKTDFARYDMSATDDGKVHALGLIAETANPNITNFRGARVIKAAFTSGNFVWTGDSIIPTVSTKPSDGAKNLVSLPYMAWNESGTVGYVFFIGGRTNQTAPENRGFQPVIFKTINSGQSWSPIPSMDFTQNTFQAPVMDHLVSTRSNTNVAVPFFNFTEGISAVVDKNNDLHIVSTLFSSSSAHPDSLGFTFNFPNADNETYSYPHEDNFRPYIYDFIGGANPTSAWKVVLVDSLLTEAPGGGAANAGFNSNPWLPDPTTGDKVVSDARIQASRTPDGRFIVYTYADSDPSVTLLRWNSVPNVKARLLDVNTGLLHPTTINITRPSAPSLRNTNVASRAFFHYVSPTCILSQTVPVGANGPAISLPMTVSNSANLSGIDPVTHRFALAALNFGGVPESNIFNGCSSVVTPTTPTNTVSVSENQSGTLNSFIFPNPTNNSAILAIGLKFGATVDVSVVNMIGQIVKTSSTAAMAGENQIPLDLSGLSKGVYMTTVKVNDIKSTKKLIIE